MPVSEPANEPTDAALVSRAQTGDTVAFDELVTRHRGKVYGIAKNMVKVEADALDLSQDTFLKAWKALPKFKGDSQFYTWLYRIAHNVCYDWLRKKKVRGGDEFDDQIHGDRIAAHAPTAPSTSRRPDRNASNQELGKEIAAAIEQLSDDHRSVILLREVHDLSYDEIAETTGTTKGTVMSRLFYARKKLQTILQRTYDETI